MYCIPYAILVVILLSSCYDTPSASGETASVLRDTTPATSISTLTVEEVFRWEDVAPDIATFGFSSDGTGLYTYADGSWQLWDMETGELVQQQQIWDGSRIYNASFSRGATIFAAGLPDNSVGVWDVASATQIATLAGHAGFIMKVAFSPDTSLIATADLNGVIYLWDAELLEEITHWQAFNNTIGSLEFSSDNTVLACGSVGGNHEIKLWSVPSGGLLSTLSGHTDNVYNLCFTESDSRLLSTSGDSTYRIWDADSGELISSTTISQEKVYGLSVTGDELLLATSDNRSLVKIWDYEEKERLITLTAPGQYVFMVEFSPSGSWIVAKAMASTGTTGSLIVWQYGYDLSVPE